LRIEGTRFSTRVPPHGELNAITRAIERLRAAGGTIADLTESNPTQVGLTYPPDLLAPLAGADALSYQPHPAGLRIAREAVAGEFARRGSIIDPDHLVLSASTSEAYGWRFKLLCDPGDTILVPHPSYPLFEHLTALEAVRTVPYRLSYHGRWDVDLPSLEDAPVTTRAVLVVSPNNPTGSFLSARDHAGLIDICRRRGWALIVDEVFVDYPLDVESPVTDVAARSDVLTFTLGGASKSIGLPQVKLGWTLIGGPSTQRDEALTALELIADTYLSVSTPVQLAAPTLLREGASIRMAIRERIEQNLQSARRLAAAYPACNLLPVEAGWTAIVRIPASSPEEGTILGLLEREHVLVHPGYFFDMPHEAFVIVSLLPRPTLFADAFDRMLRFVTS
jgi:aspartate/methionine/tyrosine aminotransferase